MTITSISGEYVVINHNFNFPNTNYVLLVQVYTTSSNASMIIGCIRNIDGNTSHMRLNSSYVQNAYLVKSTANQSNPFTINYIGYRL